MRKQAPGQPLQRTDAEIEATLDLRGRRALAHYAALCEGGGRDRVCTVCGYKGRFSPVRHKPDAWCPACDSRPRHRLFALWMQADRDAFRGARVLHFAAEDALSALIRPVAAEYVTADINDLFDLQIDVTAMDLPDGRFDAILCNHVLEHVDDDKALAEMFRVLTPGGLAVLSVPLVAGWDETFALPEAAGAEERAFRLTDPDHRRMYGRDFADRIAAAGFAVSTFVATEPAVGDNALQRGEAIYLARRPVAAPDT